MLSGKNLQETCFFFMNRKLGMCARFNNCTVGIVKPHAMMEGMSIIFMTLSPTEALRTRRRVELDVIWQDQDLKAVEPHPQMHTLLYIECFTQDYF